MDAIFKDLSTRIGLSSFTWLPPLLALLLYLPALHGGLVWDDPLFLHHPLYRTPVDGAQVLSRPFVLSPNYYRPLAVTSFLLFGTAPGPQHLANLLLHGVNTALVTLLAMRLFRRERDEWPWRVLAAPLLYAVHPALVEGVAFISGRFDLLVTAFLLLALLADHALRGHGWLRPLTVGAAVLVAALSKEMAAGFLFLLPLWHLATGDSPSFRRLVQREWPVYLAVLLALAAYGGIRYAALGYLYLPAGGNPLPTGSPFQHVLLVARSLAEYLLLAVWPFTALRPIHYSPLPIAMDDGRAWLSLAVCLAVLTGVVLWLRREACSGALAAAAFVALLPVLNILPLELGGGAFVAERFLLFPLALLALAVGAVASQERRRALRPVLAVWGLAAVAVVQLTVPHWRSDQTLWEWGIRRAPQSPTPYTNLALVAVNQGNPALGLMLAEEALARDPNDDSAHNHRGLALFHLGRHQEAEASFARAVELAPASALYWSNRAGALREQGRLQEAGRMLLDEALRRDPALWVAHFNLGLVYLKADRPDLAVQALSDALRLAPPGEQDPIRASLEQADDPRRWLRLADLLLANGQPEEALWALDGAEARGAGPLEVAVGRSAALLALERLDEAEALLQTALLSAPQDARVYNNLGMIAQRRGDVEAARRFFERAIELAPEWETPRHNLAGLGR